MADPIPADGPDPAGTFDTGGDDRRGDDRGGGPPPAPMADRLRSAALATVRELGIAGVSARTVATRAGANQASIYYHFGSLTGLLAEASLAATEARVATYRPRFAAVTTVGELVDLARELHATERELGNVAVLAQMLAGAQNEPELAAPVTEAVHLWVTEVEATLERLLAGSAVAELVDTRVLARAVSASFVGTELLDGVDGEGTALPTLDALEQLGGLVQVVLDLGPVASGALRRWLERRTGSRRD